MISSFSNALVFLHRGCLFGVVVLKKPTLRGWLKMKEPKTAIQEHKATKKYLIKNTLF